MPYIDRVVYDILEDREVLLLKVLNGEIDMMSRHFNTNDNKAVIADNREAGSFLLMLSVLTVIGTLISDLLLAWLDPRIRFE